MKFFEVVPYKDALQIAEGLIKTAAKEEVTIKTADALGKVLPSDITARENLPPFDKSTVDGYAVRASDTFGASEAVPSIQELAGQIEMGEEYDGELLSGQAVYIPTGARMPKGADSAVMIENCQVFGKFVAIHKSIAVGGNVLYSGADVKVNSTVAARGNRITPFSIAALAGLGVEYLNVYRALRISVISTGDEIVGISENITAGQVRDINTYLLSSLIEKDGHKLVYSTHCKDDFDEIAEAVIAGARISDIVLVSGGSSQGKKDYVKPVLEKLCPKLLINGIALKPGKPTLAASLDGAAVFGLPGHPMAAAVVYEALISQAIGNVRGQSKEFIWAKAAINFPSTPGRTTCQPVSLSYEEGEAFALPLFSKSGAVSALSKAQGYVLLDENAEGVEAGKRLRVRRFG